MSSTPVLELLPVRHSAEFSPLFAVARWVTSSKWCVSTLPHACNQTPRAIAPFRRGARLKAATVELQATSGWNGRKEIRKSLTERKESDSNE